VRDPSRPPVAVGACAPARPNVRTNALRSCPLLRLCAPVVDCAASPCGRTAAAVQLNVHRIAQHRIALHCTAEQCSRGGVAASSASIRYDTVMLLAENEKLRKDLKRSNEQVWSALGRQAPRRASLPPARPGPSRLRRPAHTTASTSATAALTLLPRVECAVAARARAWPSRRVRLLRHRCREIRLDLAHPPAGHGARPRELCACRCCACATARWRSAPSTSASRRSGSGSRRSSQSARAIRPYAERKTSPLGICAAAAVGRGGL
jgi:hypothetical protein